MPLRMVIWARKFVVMTIAISLVRTAPIDEDVLSPFNILRAQTYLQNELDGPVDEYPPISEQQMVKLSRYLTEVLEEPWTDEKNPLLYIEEYEPLEDFLGSESELFGSALKRSGYHRRYPWKRQNPRSKTYYSGDRFLCQPSREEVYRLLITMHDSRKAGRSINFCNRRRPVSTIYNNIHFLGRDRK